MDTDSSQTLRESSVASDASSTQYGQTGFVREHSRIMRRALRLRNKALLSSTRAERQDKNARRCPTASRFNAHRAGSRLRELTAPSRRTVSRSSPTWEKRQAAATGGQPSRRRAMRQITALEQSISDTTIPTNPPGSSFIAVVSVSSAKEVGHTLREQSHFPGELLTDNSVSCLEEFQLQHIIATIGNGQYRFEIGDLTSERFVPVFGYLRQLVLHSRALETWSPATEQDKYEAKVFPSFPGQPLPGGISRPLDKEQVLHVIGVYTELSGYKDEIEASQKSAYNYLLGCMEQLIHHVRCLEAEIMRRDGKDLLEGP